MCNFTICVISVCSSRAHNWNRIYLIIWFDLYMALMHNRKGVSCSISWFVQFLHILSFLDILVYLPVSIKSLWADVRNLQMDFLYSYFFTPNYYIYLYYILYVFITCLYVMFYQSSTLSLLWVYMCNFTICVISVCSSRAHNWNRIYLIIWFVLYMARF
jgi:hypothetical protein